LMNARGSEGFCPSSPQPPSPKGEKGEFGRPEAQNERRNAGASKKTALIRPQTPGIPYSLVGAAVHALRVSGSGAAARLPVLCAFPDWVQRRLLRAHPAQSAL